MKITPLFCFALIVALSGCATIPDHQSVPKNLIEEVKLTGVIHGRFWGDELPQFTRKSLLTMSQAEARQNFSGIYAKPHNYLAISGGGANGAFGAGLLAGWSAAGTRPQFTMVTGVSTGALTAPFAFLGSDYDDQLKEIYTTISTKDIANKRNVIAVALGDSLAHTEPLQKLLKKYITAEMVDDIATETKKGRRLFVGTVNLEAGRSVIWNIGFIAASNRSDKVELIHKILLASASIPIAFPPVSIPVEHNGTLYDELHVDGGTGSQVFVYPAAIDWRKIKRVLRVKGKPNVYVIRNSFLDPNYLGMKRNLLPIGMRTIDSLIRTQGIGDLYQIYALTERDGNVFNLAYIPPDFTEESKEEFDPVYMTKLFERGYQMGVDGYPWKKAPPGFILK
ncbi:MAG: patatin-like phospholipase family protein [Pseudomonadota bacterium]|nr:patatin-like phospholipase family protein [Pseudomonadota bacterium]